jgi:hypothetical protein
MMIIQILVPFVELVEGSLISRDIGDLLEVPESTAERMILTGTALPAESAETPADTAPKARVYRRKSE